MSRGRFWLALAATALGIAVFASTATAQPDETGGVLLPAKLDAEGFSQMLIPYQRERAHLLVQCGLGRKPGALTRSRQGPERRT